MKPQMWMKKWGVWFACLAAAGAGSFSFPQAVFAEPTEISAFFAETTDSAEPTGLSAATEEPDKIQAILSGEDEENGYRYECAGIGGFSSSVMEGETATAAIITADEGLSWSLSLDGAEQEYENGQLIFAEGLYEYNLYRAEGSGEQMGTFHFRIENAILEGQGEIPFTVEEEPELTLILDGEGGPYRYTLPGGSFFSMTIPMGAAGKGEVSLEFSEEFTVYSAVLDGKTVNGGEELTFSEPGTYQITCMASLGDNSQKSGIYRLEIPFIILPEGVNNRDILWAPEGFVLESAYCGGRPVPRGREYLEIAKDGFYSLEYAAASDRSIRYRLEFFADRRPPRLTFSKNIYDPELTAPLSFTCPERDCTVTVFQNGMEMSMVPDVLEEGGQYRIQVTDPAGNTQVYQFFAAYGRQPLEKTEIILLAVLGAGGLGWLLYLRRHMGVL